MIRYKRRDLSEVDEQQARDRIRQQLEQLNERPASLPQVYWNNLLVRSNKRIDDATSAKALSISWAARVAIPGVVAIIFFFIGLHYYVPEMPARSSSLSTFVNMLPDSTVDSVLTAPDRFDVSLSGDDVTTDIFQFSNDQITDYLVASGNTQMAVEGMDDTDVTALLSALNAKTNL